MNDIAEQKRLEADGAPDVASPFVRIGGAESIDRLVEAFYARMDRLPEAQPIRAMHAPDLAPTKDVLKRYLGEWMGGPKLYSAERGHPRLRMRHIRFKIGEAERDAWLLCMGGRLRTSWPTRVCVTSSTRHSPSSPTGCATIPAIRTIASTGARSSASGSAWTAGGEAAKRGP